MESQVHLILELEIRDHAVDIHVATRNLTILRSPVSEESYHNCDGRNCTIFISIQSSNVGPLIQAFS